MYVFLFPPILAMIHLCIMLYTYWMPLDAATRLECCQLHFLYPWHMTVYSRCTHYI